MGNQNAPYIHPPKGGGITAPRDDKYQGKIKESDKDDLIMALVRRICHLEEKYEDNEVIQAFLAFKEAMAINWGIIPRPRKE